MKRELVIYFLVCGLMIATSATTGEVGSTSGLKYSSTMDKGKPAGSDDGDQNEKRSELVEDALDLTIYARGKAIYGSSDLIPRKPSKSGTQSSLKTPSSRLYLSTFLASSSTLVLCLLI